MELIKEIYDDGFEQHADQAYRVRKAARAVVINDRDEIALLFVANGNYHKLPGGGIENNETIYDALKREVEEEVGTMIEDIEELEELEEEDLDESLSDEQRAEIKRQRQIEELEKIREERKKTLILACVGTVVTALAIVGFMVYLSLSGQL